MKDHEGDIKGFYHHASAWYAKHAPLERDLTDQVMFGWFAPGGGTSGEIAMEWVPLRGSTPTPRLACYDDAWHALGTFTDVIAALAERDNDDMTPREFCDLLLALGFTDLTKRERA